MLIGGESEVVGCMDTRNREEDDRFRTCVKLQGVISQLHKLSGDLHTVRQTGTLDRRIGDRQRFSLYPDWCKGLQ